MYKDKVAKMHKSSNISIFKMKLEFLMIFGVSELFWRFAQNDLQYASVISNTDHLLILCACI